VFLEHGTGIFKRTLNMRLNKTTLTLGAVFACLATFAGRKALQSEKAPLQTNSLVVGETDAASVALKMRSVSALPPDYYAPRPFLERPQYRHFPFEKIRKSGTEVLMKRFEVTRRLNY
jgi:hypothetical protein